MLYSFDNFTNNNIIDRSKIPSNDYVASIEVNVCRGARRFIGSTSTMSFVIQALRTEQADVPGIERSSRFVQREHSYANVNVWLELQRQKCLWWSAKQQKFMPKPDCNYHQLANESLDQPGMI